MIYTDLHPVIYMVCPTYPKDLVSCKLKKNMQINIRHVLIEHTARTKYSNCTIATSPPDTNWGLEQLLVGICNIRRNLCTDARSFLGTIMLEFNIQNLGVRMFSKNDTIKQLKMDVSTTAAALVRTAL